MAALVSDLKIKIQTQSNLVLELKIQIQTQSNLGQDKTGYHCFQT